MSYMDDFFNNTQLFIPESFDEVRTYAKQIEYLADWCSELEDAIGTDRDYQDIKERVSLLETEYEALSEKLSTDEGVLTTHTEEISSIKSQIEDIKADIEILQSGKQDKLTAGTGISIVDNVISATGGGGSTVSVTVGTTTTGEAGTQASVVNSGTDENVVLDFTIPRGATGEQGPAGPIGPQGEAGPQGPQGEKGNTGATGEAGPTGPTGLQGEPGFSPTVTVTEIAGGHSVVITDATTEHEFDVMDGATGEAGPQGPIGPQGPQGEKGDTGATGETGATGPQGEPGVSPTVTVGTVTTGEAGTNASVVNSGTDENVVLDFVIPKGDAGSSFTYPDGYPVDTVITQASRLLTATPVIYGVKASGTCNVYSGVVTTNEYAQEYIAQTISVMGLKFTEEQATASGYTDKLFRWHFPTTMKSGSTEADFPTSVMYVHLTPTIIGQVRIAKETEAGYTQNYLCLQLGYTKDASGNAVNIPTNSTIYFRMPIV